MELFYLILILGIGLGFYIQGVAGFAAALISAPILLIVLNIQEVVALLSIFFFLFSIALVFENWKYIDKTTVLHMSAGALIGIIFGVLLLKYTDPYILKKILGLFIIFYVIYSYIEKSEIRLFKYSESLFGLLSGIFSGLFSTGGPVAVFYIFNQIKDSNIARATLIGFLAVNNAIRVPVLIISDILTYKILLLAIYLLPVFIIASYLGNKTYERIDARFFKKIVMALLLISGISLIIT